MPNKSASSFWVHFSLVLSSLILFIFSFPQLDYNTKNKEIRNTLCVSSQVGCPVKCSFCATGQSGYMRNLSVSEILNQVYTVERRLRKKGETLNNLVFMGMGEPLLNIDNLAKSLSIISNKNGVNISKRKITISTSGVVSGIEKILLDKSRIFRFHFHYPRLKNLPLCY